MIQFVGAPHEPISQRGKRKMGAMDSTPSAPHPPRRPRKERQPNWTQVEISALIRAKREKFFDELENVHEPNLMRRENTQWRSIADRVMEICGQLAECYRDSAACKDKWATLLVDYKKIHDYHNGTGTNEDYWSMSSPERAAKNLPRNFLKENYNDIDDWFRIRPIMNPPHSRDLSQPGDAVYNRAAVLHRYNVPKEESSDGPGGTHVGDVPPLNSSTLVEADDHGKLRASTKCKSKVVIPARVSIPASNTPGAAPANTLEVLSSSEASFEELTRVFGNTGHRRKSLSGHTKIAEATQTSSDKLVSTLEKLNERDTQLQWKIFQEQLNYNKERDLIAQENVRLTHANQSSLVQAITSLTNVLSLGLRPPVYSRTTFEAPPLHQMYGGRALNYPPNYPPNGGAASFPPNGGAIRVNNVTNQPSTPSKGYADSTTEDNNAPIFD